MQNNEEKKNDETLRNHFLAFQLPLDFTLLVSDNKPGGKAKWHHHTGDETEDSRQGQMPCLSQDSLQIKTPQF